MKALIILLFALSPLWVHQATATPLPAERPADQPFLLTGSTSITPQHNTSAYKRYCEEERPDFCQARSVAPKVVLKDKGSILLKVTRAVNDYRTPVGIRYVHDQEQYGHDYITGLSKRGDCQDFVARKKAILVDQYGFDPSTLLMMRVRTDTVDDYGSPYHLVLVVRTDKGDYYLDNMTDQLIRWDHSPHTPLMVRAPEHGGEWRRVVDTRFM